MALFTPINQKRLTNVSVVKLQRSGYRFELACYPNKVKAWREKVEPDLNEVLQTYMIFSNVSKGQFANKKELQQAFPDVDDEYIIKYILEHGAIQVTDLERKANSQALYRDVAKIIADKCVNPENNRQYTVTMIEKMMKDCHINLKSNKNAKQQALEVIRQLKSVEGFKIAPAMLDVCITVDKRVLSDVLSQIKSYACAITREDNNSELLFEMEIVIEPEQYHKLDQFLRHNIRKKYALEILGRSKVAINKNDRVKVADDLPIPHEASLVSDGNDEDDGALRETTDGEASTGTDQCTPALSEKKTPPTRRRKGKKGKCKKDFDND